MQLATTPHLSDPSIHTKYRRVTTMYHRRLVTIFAFVLLIFPCALSASQAAPEAQSPMPREVRYSGVLQDAAGGALTGVQGVTFALYAE